MKNALIALLSAACVLLTVTLCLVGVHNSISYSERQSFVGQIADLQAQVGALQASTNSMALSNQTVSSNYEVQIADWKAKLDKEQTNEVVFKSQIVELTVNCASMAYFKGRKDQIKEQDDPEWRSDSVNDVSALEEQIRIDLQKLFPPATE